MREIKAEQAIIDKQLADLEAEERALQKEMEKIKNSSETETPTVKHGLDTFDVSILPSQTQKEIKKELKIINSLPEGKTKKERLQKITEDPLSFFQEELRGLSMQRNKTPELEKAKKRIRKIISEIEKVNPKGAAASAKSKEKPAKPETPPVTREVSEPESSQEIIMPLADLVEEKPAIEQSTTQTSQTSEKEKEETLKKLWAQYEEEEKTKSEELVDSWVEEPQEIIASLDDVLLNDKERKEKAIAHLQETIERLEQRMEERRREREADEELIRRLEAELSQVETRGDVLDAHLETSEDIYSKINELGAELQRVEGELRAIENSTFSLRKITGEYKKLKEKYTQLGKIKRILYQKLYEAEEREDKLNY